MARTRRLLILAIASVFLFLVLGTIGLLGATHMRAVTLPTGALMRYGSYSLRGVNTCAGVPPIYHFSAATACDYAESWELVAEEELRSPANAVHQWWLLSIPLQVPE